MRLYRLFTYLFSLFTISIIVSCARMGGILPDGGWYDEDPPKVIGSMPLDGGTNVSQKKITIYFDEYIQIDNATENVVISPPQLEQAEIKTKGKSIVVELKDTLKQNTTYTVDFSDAIKDNNESNPMGNYTYSFSTGNAIDTMQVAGYVIDAETLEPEQGILVGLYANLEDSAFTTSPMLRVSRTDADGHFSIKGVKPGKYRVYALKDMDNNFMLTPKTGEACAFLKDVLIPNVYDDFRQDTIWQDSLRIKDIKRLPYKHFTPDDVVLRSFTRTLTDRAFLKSERPDADHFSLYFTYGDSLMPEIKGLNFYAENAFLIEKNINQDSITYWLRDTALVNTDSLELQMTYRMTDTLGILRNQTDTLMVLPKLTHAKRMKEQQKKYDEWFKKEKKKMKKGLPYDSIMPPDPMKLNIKASNSFSPDDNVYLEFDKPLQSIDSSMIHLYLKRDTLWYPAEWELQDLPNGNIRTLKFLAEWQPETEYSLEIDSACFMNIYGEVSDKIKKGIKVNSLSDYGTFDIRIPSLKGKNLICQMLESGDKVAKTVKTTSGEAKFYYLSEKPYYFRVIVDENDNGKWDTGDYEENLQPEEIFYYPKEIECKAKRDIIETWDPSTTPLYRQKPGKLRKSQSTKKKQNRVSKNLQRAQQLGIELPEYLRK